MILANNLGLLCQSYRSDSEPSVLFAWLSAVGFFLQIYFDFSGYSDMAIGLGRILGFHFPETFGIPTAPTRSPNSGGGGTSVWALGFGIMSTFPWAETAQGNCAGSETSCWSGV